DPPRLRHAAAGRVRPRAGEPGVHERARQRVRRDPRAREPVAHDARRGRPGARHHPGRRRRHGAGGGGPHLRPVLHHQGRGRRDGARARHQPGRARGAQWRSGLETHEPAVIVADQRMPAMSGTEVLERSMAVRPDAVRIILTGYTDIDAITQAINKSRVYRYVTKPWESEELRLTLR